MPCHNASHNHVWSDRGVLIIEKCEKICGYCEGVYAEHQWRYAWFLRRHVSTVHCGENGDHPDVVVSDDWTGMPPRKPRRPRRSPEKKANGEQMMENNDSPVANAEPTTPSKQLQNEISSMAGAEPRMSARQAEISPMVGVEPSISAGQVKTNISPVVDTEPGLPVRQEQTSSVSSSSLAGDYVDAYGNIDSTFLDALSAYGLENTFATGPMAEDSFSFAPFTGVVPEGPVTMAPVSGSIPDNSASLAPVTPIKQTTAMSAPRTPTKSTWKVYKKVATPNQKSKQKKAPKYKQKITKTKEKKVQPGTITGTPVAAATSVGSSVVDDPFVEDSVAGSLIYGGSFADDPFADTSIAEDPMASSPITGSWFPEGPFPKDGFTEDLYAEDPIFEDLIVEDPVSKLPATAAPTEAAKMAFMDRVKDVAQQGMDMGLSHGQVVQAYLAATDWAMTLYRRSIKVEEEECTFDE